MPVVGQVPSRYWLYDEKRGQDLTKAFVFRTMGYEIHAQEVADFHLSEAPIRIASAPAQTSKSYSAGAEVVALTQSTRPLLDNLVWIVGPTYETNKEFQYVFDWYVNQRELWRVGGVPLDIERAHNNPANGQMEIVLKLGRDHTGHWRRVIIKGMSSTNERSLQGEHVSVVVMSEAAEHPEHIWSKYLSTRYSRAILPSTPKPRAEWIKRMIEEGEKDPSLGIAHFTYPPHANPHYDHERFERERKRAQLRSPTGKAEDDPYFAEQFLGKWVYYTGMVLPFQEGRHVLADLAPEIVRHSKCFVSLDYGYTHASVAHIWAVLATGALVVVDEVYEKGLDSLEFRDHVESMCGRWGVRPAFVTGDPSRPEVGALLQRMGFPVPISINKNMQRDREVGHRRLVDLLTPDPAFASPQHPDGQPRLYFLRRCAKTIAELKHLRYREGCRDEYSKAALEGDDDAYDSLRYGAMTLPSPRPEPEERDWLREHKRAVRMRRANASPMAAQLGASRWAATGVSPYG